MILLGKTRKYNKCVFATQLIFCNIPKSNGKIPLDLVEGALAMLSFRSAYKYVVPAPVYRGQYHFH